MEPQKQGNPLVWFEAKEFSDIVRRAGIASDKVEVRNPDGEQLTPEEERTQALFPNLIKVPKRTVYFTIESRTGEPILNQPWTNTIPKPGNVGKEEGKTETHNIFGNLQELSFAFVAIYMKSSPNLDNPDLISNLLLTIGERPKHGELLSDKYAADSETLPESQRVHAGIDYLSVFRVSDRGLALLKDYEKRNPGNVFEKIKDVLMARLNEKFRGQCMNCRRIFDLDESDIQAVIDASGEKPPSDGSILL